MGDNNPTEGDTNKTTVPDTAAAATTSPTATAAPSEPVGERKIDIFFKNTGNAPVIRDNKTKWKVKPSTKLSEISNLLVKILKLDTSQSIFIYVNQSFAPSLDQTIQNLYDCYECDKRLVLYYATTQAWG